MFARRSVRARLYAALGLIGASMAIATEASAQVLEGNLLLRQVDPTGIGYVNQVFGDFPDFSTAMGSMVTTLDPWNVSNIQIYLIPSGSNTWYGNVNTAVLNVSRQAAGVPDPSIDPALPTNTGPAVVYSGIVPVVTDQGIEGDQKFRLGADTTGIAELQGLAPGDYVFTLTGIADFSTFGQAFTATALVLSAQEDWIRNTGEGFGLTANWRTLPDALGASAGTNWAIGINGSVVPEPSALIALAAGFGALAAKRRRSRTR